MVKLYMLTFLLLAFATTSCRQRYYMYDLFDDRSTADVSDLVYSKEYVPCIDSNGIVLKLLKFAPPLLTEIQSRKLEAILDSVVPEDFIEHHAFRYAYTYRAGYNLIHVFELKLGSKTLYARTTQDTLMPGIQDTKWMYGDCSRELVH